MNESYSAPPTLRDWCQLIRLPNVCTVLADTSAAYLLVAHDVHPLPRFLLILLAVVALYWGGMILNDVWDLEVDRRESSSRPLPAGRIDVALASRVGWSFLVAGIMIAGIAGTVPLPGAVTNLVPAGVAFMLVITIVLYNGPIKRTPVAPLAMGACRFLSFVLGATAALPTVGRLPYLPDHVLAIAAGFGIYIMGVTISARGEATAQRKLPLVIGLLVMIAGLVIISFAPRLAPAGVQFMLDPQRGYPLLIGLIALTILHRAARAISDPNPHTVQMSVKHAILSLIPLSAGVAFLGAGPIAAMGVLALVVPAMTLGSFLRVT